MKFTRALLVFATLAATAACSAPEERRYVTEIEQARPAEPSAGEVLVVDWSQANATKIDVDGDTQLTFGGSRYGVVALDSELGHRVIKLKIPPTVDPAVWLVSPARRAVTFVRGRDRANLVDFAPEGRGRYFLVIRDAHFGEGEVVMSLDPKERPSTAAGH